MRSRFIVVVTTLALGSLGCGESVDEGPEIMVPESDVTADGGADTCAAPTEGFGTSEGRRFLPFTLQRCDGTDYEFYGEAEGFCDARFTVVSIAAGWCGPCRREAELMQEYLVERYAEDGVRVIVAIIQDNDYSAPSPSFCEGWRAQYGLTNPVLLDPTQETQVYFPAGSLPATLIVDSSGVIVHREYGVSTELATVRAELDNLLRQ